jgi:hypothetical protein
MSILVMIFAVGAFAALLASAHAARQEKFRVIQDELRALGASPMRSGNAVMGSIGGMAVTYELRPTRRRTASAANTWSGSSTYQTFCTALIPGDCPRLEMELRPQNAAELRQVEKGRAIDLVLGDEMFDDAFIVEAAPSETARALLAEPIRAALLTFMPCRLTIAAQEHCFEKDGSVDEPGEVRRLVELCVGACARLASLSGQMQQQQLALAGELGGYRGPSPEALRALGASSRDQAEIEALNAARRRRKNWRKAQMVSGILLAVLFLITWLAFGGGHHGPSP